MSTLKKNKIKQRREKEMGLSSVEILNSVGLESFTNRG